MRRLAFAFLVLLLLLPLTARADGESGDAAISDGVESWMADVDWRAFNDLLAAMPEETRALWSGINIRELAERIALSGSDAEQSPWNEGLLLAMGRRTLGDTVKALSGTIATLLGLALIGALGNALCESEKGGVRDAAAFVCRCFTLTVVASTFASMASLASACAQNLCRCIEVAMPVLVTLLTALGGVASVGVLQPATALLTGGVGKCMQTVVIPLLTCAGLLSMFDHLSERVRLAEMSALIRSVVKWSIGIVTTLYTSITALRGMTAAAFDGVSVRAAKYAAGSMFPMVGGIVGGSFDTVLGCAGLVKNAAGMTAILLGVSVAIGPMLRIAITMLLFRLTAAALQPVAEKNQVAMCRAGADMLSGLLSACAAITAMFVMTAGLAVAIGNAGMA